MLLNLQRYVATRPSSKVYLLLGVNIVLGILTAPQLPPSVARAQPSILIRISGACSDFQIETESACVLSEITRLSLTLLITAPSLARRVSPKKPREPAGRAGDTCIFSHPIPWCCSSAGFVKSHHAAFSTNGDLSHIGNRSASVSGPATRGCRCPLPICAGPWFKAISPTFT